MQQPTLPARIDSVERLSRYLYHAMQIEHATLPPYLLALYSIHPGTNLDATQVIRAVVVEEMLHLTLAANLLNSIGGKPDLTSLDFVPLYPAYLPDGEDDFEVSLTAFSREALETFVKIERPSPAPSEAKRLVRRAPKASALAAAPDDKELHFYSIGEFYEEVRRGFDHLHDKLGDKKLFTGDPARQADSRYYYSGGGKLIPVTDIKSAREAISLIIEQGEGFGGGIYNDEHELAHLYRFEQLLKQRYYQKGDKPGNPTGPMLTVDWNAVFPIKKNARLTDYPEASELHAAAIGFNGAYAEFLDLLTRAYNGNPELLLTQAVPRMFELRNRINQLIRNPVPGLKDVNAAPTFEMAGVFAAGVPA
jgi:Ferritin-like